MKRLRALLVSLLLSGMALAQSSSTGGGITTTGTVTAGHCVSFASSNVIQDSGGACGGTGSSPGGSSTAFQFNSTGVFGGTTLTDISYVSPKVIIGTTGQLDVSAASVTAGLKLPSAAAAAPTADGFLAFNTTNHRVVYGSNGSTLTVPVAITDLTGTIALSQTQLTTNGDLWTVSGGVLSRLAITNNSILTAASSLPAWGPVMSTAGDIMYFTGTVFARLAGNTSGTNCLQENASGVPTWAGCATGTITATGSPANGNLTKFSGATSITNGDLSGDVTTSGTLVTTAVAINGNTVPSGAAAHQALVCTGASTCTWKTVTDCHTGQQALNYTQSTDTFSCLTITALVNPMTTLGDMIYGGASGSPTQLSGPTSVNGVPQFITETPSGGVAVAPVWNPAGVPLNNQAGVSYTFLATDRTSEVVFNSGSSVAVTLPQAGSTGFASNYVTGAKDIGAGVVTITPTTSTINGTSTLVMNQGDSCVIYSDNTNYTSKCDSGQSTVASPITVTRSASGDQFGLGVIGLANTPLTTNGDVLTVISGSLSRLGQGGNGTFLGVSGGSLGYFTPSGSGTVTSSGPPTAGQFPLWTTATNLSGTTLPSGDLIVGTSSTPTVQTKQLSDTRDQSGTTLCDRVNNAGTAFPYEIISAEGEAAGTFPCNAVNLDDPFNEIRFNGATIITTDLGFEWGNRQVVKGNLGNLGSTPATSGLSFKTTANFPLGSGGSMACTGTSTQGTIHCTQTGGVTTTWSPYSYFVLTGGADATIYYLKNCVTGVGNCASTTAGGADSSTWYTISATAAASITAWSITTNVATFTAANAFVAGQNVTLSGFGTSTFFNGQTAQVLSAGLSGTQFEINFTHGNGSATEAGMATPSTLLQVTPVLASSPTAVSATFTAPVIQFGDQQGGSPSGEQLFGAQIVCTASGTAGNGIGLLDIQAQENSQANNVGIINCQRGLWIPSGANSGNWDNLNITYTADANCLNPVMPFEISGSHKRVSRLTITTQSCTPSKITNGIMHVTNAQLGGIGAPGGIVIDQFHGEAQANGSNVAVADMIVVDTANPSPALQTTGPVEISGASGCPTISSHNGCVSLVHVLSNFVGTLNYHDSSCNTGTINAIKDDINGNTMLCATGNNAKALGFYRLDDNGTAYTDFECADMTKGWCRNNGVWAYYSAGVAIIKLNGPTGAITGSSLILNGSSSGSLTITPQATAGTPTWTAGTSSGTPAVTASSPLAITTATGNATCATCATTTNGGALSATAPLTISAAGVIAGIPSASAGQVLGYSGATTLAANDLWLGEFIPAANCNNTTAGAGWSIPSGGTVTCRAGTNNLGGYITITDTSTTFAQFTERIPFDWDTASNPYIRFFFASASDTTNGHTVIPQVKVSCSQAVNGTTSDDATFSAALSSSTVTFGASAVANGFYGTSNVQFGSTQMSGCTAGGLFIVQVGRATDTATGNINFYGADVTWPHKTPGTSQAN